MAGHRWNRRRLAAGLAAGLLGALLALPAAGAADGDEGDAIRALEELGRRLRARKVWTADYRQEYVPVGMARGDTEAGRVWLAWPDRALFVTGDPARRLMGLEGRTVRLVDLEMESCEEHRLTDEEWERIPLVAVLDPRAARERFGISMDGPDRLVLLPLVPGGISRAVVRLGPDGLPAEVTVTDTQGTVNNLRFTGWSGADGPPGDRWLPAPPEAVTCQRTDDRGDDPR